MKATACQKTDQRKTDQRKATHRKTAHRKAARRKAVRQKFCILVLCAIVLLLFIRGIATSGNGTIDYDLTAQDNPNAQISDPTGSGSQPASPSTPASDNPTSTRDNWAIATGGNGTADHDLTAQDNPNVQTSDSTGSASQSTPPSIPTLDNPASAGDDWALVLVNWEYALPDDFHIPELTQLRNGHAVDSRAYPELQAMMDDARAAGLQPLICSSYRTWDTQERLYEQKVQNWMDRGYIREEAIDRAAMWVARPGTSEHQTGLALDIVDTSYQILDEGQEDTPVQKWLISHCAEYGFILRYPTNKSDLTGVGYEPWHYRYVGVEAAQEIMGHGLCLEEYLHGET